MNYDFHTHSTYSDGHVLKSMAGAADRLGLEKLGVTDHCNVSDRSEVQALNIELGFNLDQTYRRRKKALKLLNKEFDVELLDAVEMDFHPDDMDRITEFLDKAGFQYSIGSVHRIDNLNLQVESLFTSMGRSRRRSIVERYFERQRKLIESEVFDIVSHIDLVERNRHLRGLARRKDYIKLLEALKESGTVPEINAGRINRGLKEFHPTDELLNLIKSEGLPVTLGTDSHRPSHIENRMPRIRDKVKEKGLELTSPEVREFTES